MSEPVDEMRVSRSVASPHISPQMHLFQPGPNKKLLEVSIDYLQLGTASKSPPIIKHTTSNNTSSAIS